MQTSPSPRHIVRFGAFEADLREAELRRSGLRQKLGPQPFELLRALLERPGELITREELRDRLWPSSTFVDFDLGLKKCVNRVREVLGDSADHPRFIETVPRRGYRFIGAIQQERAPDPAPAVKAPPPAMEFTTAPEELRPKQYRKFWISVAIATITIIAGVTWWFATHRAADKGPIQLQQLTTNSSENPIEHAVISPDGGYLAYGDRAGIQIRLISTGESHLLPRPQGVSADDIWAPVAWFPDQTHLLASSVQRSPGGQAVSAWTVSVIGGTAVRIREHALVQSISPDGSLIAFTTSRNPNWENEPFLGVFPAFLEQAEIWIMDLRGENVRRVVRGDDLTFLVAVRWSPDSKRLAYFKSRPSSRSSWDAIESCNLNGHARSTIFSRQEFNDDIGDFAWLPDNRVVFPLRENPSHSRDSSLWQIGIDPRTGTPRGQPQRIAILPSFIIQGLTVGADGKMLVFERTMNSSQVYVAGLAPDGRLIAGRRLTQDETHNWPWAWTPDSRAVIFTSDRTGTQSIYKQVLDAQVPELIPTGSADATQPRVSPDGTSLVYLIPSSKEAWRFMRVPLAGAPSQTLFESERFNWDCPHRPGMQCIGGESTPIGGPGRAPQVEVFFSFDWLSGARHQLFRKPQDANFTVSPDGSRIAATPDGHIEIWSLSGKIEKKIYISGWAHPLSIDWAADGKAVYISHQGLIGSPSGPIGVTLLRVDLEGHVKAIWEARGGRRTWAIASPDGKYLAINEPVTERNAWMMENF